ncbi:MAG: hypothetical protein WAQ24_00680 [Candidatus Saccharimonadales bacterium]
MTPRTAELHDAIVSSTGEVGIPEHRIDPLGEGAHNRVTLTLGQMVCDVAEIDSAMHKVVSVADKINSDGSPNAVTRRIARFLTTPNVLNELMQSKHAKSVEAVMTFGDDKVLVWTGQNDTSRPSVPINSDKYTADIESLTSTAPKKTPSAIIGEAVESGVVFRDLIIDTPEWRSQLLNLWGGTFGWEEYQINALAERLIGEQHLDPADKTLWFSATELEGKIVGAAMAERFDLVDEKGEKISFVESTEWKRKSGTMGHSPMAATLVALHAQVLRDVPEAHVYAECNETSGAYNVAHRVRMTESKNDLALLAAQKGMVALRGIQNVLRANVYIDDGVEPPTPRNFRVLYLSDETVAEMYNTEQVQAVCNTIRGN